MQNGIAFAGTIAFDEIFHIDSYPKSSQLATIKRIKRSTGGLVTNCAIALAKIDHSIPVKTIALVGDDDKGKFILEQLNKYPNIDTSGIKIVGETPFTNVYQSEADKSRTFFTFRGNSGLFDEEIIDFTSLNVEILHIGYILLLDRLDQEDAEYGTKMAKLLKKAQDAGIKTSIDVVSENSERYKKLVPPSLKFANYCILNEIEAGKTVGIEVRDTDGALIIENIERATYALKSMGVKEWVIIHAPEGSIGFDGRKMYKIPSLKIESKFIKGTVGAGDAFAAGVLYGALNNFQLKEAMELGTASAASSLFEEDSTSGIKPYEELRKLFNETPKRKELGES